MKRLENKVAIVTGGASGIGKTIALTFAMESADICVADINFKGASITAAEVKQMGRKSIAINVDLTCLNDLDKMVNEAVNYFGKIDILVNNAGTCLFNPVLKVTETEWDMMMNLNLKGLFFATQRVLPIMLKQGKGKIVNLASNWGAVGHRDASVYCASKAGIINLTRALALELATQNVNVNAIAPAVTRTPATEQVLDDTEYRKMLVGEVPMGRNGKPEEIAIAAVYLASDESDFVTGHTLCVDGGYLAQ